MKALNKFKLRCFFIIFFSISALVTVFLFPRVVEHNRLNEYKQIIAICESQLPEGEIISRLRSLDVDILSGDRRMTPLMYFILNKNDYAISLLMTAGADVEIITPWGSSAKDLAEQSNIRLPPKKLDKANVPIVPMNE